MAVNTDFTHWSRRGDHEAPLYEKASPNIDAIREYCENRWPGLTNLGTHMDRKISGTNTWSVHSWGAAGDIGYDPNLVSRHLLTDEIFPALIVFSKELGIQAIHDQGRIWRSYRSGDANGGWKVQRTGYGNWFHIETTDIAFSNEVPVQTRLEKAMGIEPKVVQSVKGKVPSDNSFLRFDPAEREYGLWPVRTDLPRVKRTTGAVDRFIMDTVRFVQGVILHEAGGNIVVDGAFGRQTDARVKDLQGQLDLTVDGDVGPNTMNWIQYLAAVGTGDKNCTDSHSSAA
jgi:peptidoglycan hydrolase-like protein with peptidoglycan-binding domain